MTFDAVAFKKGMRHLAASVTLITTRHAGERGGLTATAVLDPLPDFAGITSGVEVVVPVSLVDAAGVMSVRCAITIWITPATRRD